MHGHALRITAGSGERMPSASRALSGYAPSTIPGIGRTSAPMVVSVGGIEMPQEELARPAIPSLRNRLRRMLEAHPRALPDSLQISRRHVQIDQYDWLPRAQSTPISWIKS